MKNVKDRGKDDISREKDEYRGKRRIPRKFLGSARKNPNSAARLEIPRSAENNVFVILTSSINNKVTLNFRILK